MNKPDVENETAPLQQRIFRQRGLRYNRLLDPMQRAAIRGGKVWHDKDALNLNAVQLSAITALQNDIFHVDVHFSSSRATSREDLVDPDICLAYPHRPYPEDATVPADAIACDDSHYIPHEQFLAKDSAFREGME